jgi:hypothetical protein
MNPEYEEEIRRWIMAEERMSAKQYAKFDKVFFLYGSVSKMVQPVRPDEWQKIAEDMWKWAMTKVSALVDEYTDGFIEPPPEPDVSGNSYRHKLITVQAVSAIKEGETKGRKWKLSRVIDTDGVRFVTFAGHRYEVGKEYAIEWDEVPNGEYVDYRIKEPK